ncbi:MAG: DUF3237 family protein, partial [Pseudonocardiaceae bacterium]
TLTSILPIGLVTEGLRLDVAFKGTVVEGELSGASITGVDYLLVRHDGVSVIDAHERITTPVGNIIAAHAQGYITAPFEMPPLQTLTDPDFQWPDVELNLHGVLTMQTAVPELSDLAHTMFGFTGTVNVATGVLRLHARSLVAALAAAG